MLKEVIVTTESVSFNEPKDTYGFSVSVESIFTDGTATVYLQPQDSEIFYT